MLFSESPCRSDSLSIGIPSDSVTCRILDVIVEMWSHLDVLVRRPFASHRRVQLTIMSVGVYLVVVLVSLFIAFTELIMVSVGFMCLVNSRTACVTFGCRYLVKVVWSMLELCRSDVCRCSSLVVMLDYWKGLVFLVFE